MHLYRDQAVVLRTIKLGESDRIVTLLTEDHGKVRAVAKGARKTKSKVGGRLEAIRHVAVQLYEGRGDLQTVTQVESIDHFPTIRGDLDRLTRASVVVEAVDLISPDHAEGARRYRMVLGALSTLDAQPAPALVGAFLFKLLAEEGLAPMLDACVGCGATDHLVAFDPGEGGMRCRSCRSGMAIGAAGLSLLRRMLGGDLHAVLAEDVSPAIIEVETIAVATFEHLIERRLRSPRALRGDSVRGLAVR